MRQIAFSLLLILAFAGSVWADTKYNAFTGEWEVTSPDSELRYNAFDGGWSYQPPGAQLQYNAPQNTWGYAPPDVKSQLEKVVIPPKTGDT